MTWIVEKALEEMRFLIRGGRDNGWHIWFNCKYQGVLSR